MTKDIVKNSNIQELMKRRKDILLYHTPYWWATCRSSGIDTTSGTHTIELVRYFYEYWEYE